MLMLVHQMAAAILGRDTRRCWPLVPLANLKVSFSPKPVWLSNALTAESPHVAAVTIAAYVHLGSILPCSAWACGVQCWNGINAVGIEVKHWEEALTLVVNIRHASQCTDKVLRNSLVFNKKLLMPGHCFAWNVKVAVGCQYFSCIM